MKDKKKAVLISSLSGVLIIIIMLFALFRENPDKESLALMMKSGKIAAITQYEPTAG